MSHMPCEWGSGTLEVPRTLCGWGGMLCGWGGTLCDNHKRVPGQFG